MSDEMVFSSKWAKKLPEEFKEAADSMGDEELKRKIVELVGGISYVENEMTTDPDLIQLKEQVAVNSKEYKDEINKLTASMKYAAYILSQRGVVVDVQGAKAAAKAKSKDENNEKEEE